MAKPGVDQINADQCQYGQETEDGDPLKKPTGFLSNYHEILRALNNRCSGVGGSCSRPQGGRHRLCNGKFARRAVIYYQKMCKAILKGMRNQMIKDGTYTVGEAGPRIQMLDGYDGINLSAESTAETNRGDKHVDIYRMGALTPPTGGSSETRTPGDNLVRNKNSSACPFVDRAFDQVLADASRNDRFVADITGQPLSPELCREARKLEFDYFCNNHVWELRKITEAIQRTERCPISVRWVEVVNKGDSSNPTFVTGWWLGKSVDLGRRLASLLPLFLNSWPCIGVGASGCHVTEYETQQPISQNSAIASRRRSGAASGLPSRSSQLKSFNQLSTLPRVSR